MLARLKSFITGVDREAKAAAPASGKSGSTVLPSQPVPKVANKQQTAPSYLTTAKPSPKSPLIRQDRNLANTDLLTYRTSADSRQVIRDFARASPDLSAAITSYIRTGITSGYKAIAKNLDGTVNAEATSALAQIITRMNILNDYSIGFDDGYSIRSLSEVWARDILQTGAMCGELVLDKTRLPDRIHPVATAQIRLFPSTDAKKLVPKQFLAGEYIDLDIPTFFMVTLDADLQEPYPVSPIESAIQGVLFSVSFMNDIRRVVRRAIHPRMDVAIDEEKFRKAIPPEIQNDSEKLEAYMATVVADIEAKVNGLQPEDALVHFDTIGFTVVDHGNTNLSNEYKALQEMANAKIASGTKTLPTVLGQSNSNANVASAEVMMFMKYVEGTIWGKLNEMFSKVFTLAVRLLGYDVYVEFEYNAIDLRPKAELEVFKSQEQSRVLEQLSLGFISDEEASIALTGHLPSASFKPLSGTGFYGAKPAGADQAVPGGGATGANPTGVQKPGDGPKNPKGQNGGKTAPGKQASVFQ